MKMEIVVVVAFVIAGLILTFGGIALMIFGVSADEEGDFPRFLTHKIVTRVAAVCLALLALGFPVIAFGNEKYFPASFLLSAVALLIATRILFGNKARWATWTAAGLIAVLIVFPMLIKLR